MKSKAKHFTNKMNVHEDGLVKEKFRWLITERNHWCMNYDKNRKKAENALLLLLLRIGRWEVYVYR